MRILFFAATVIALVAFTRQTRIVWLDDIENIESYAESIRPTKSKTSYTDDSMRIGGVYFNRGLGMQTVSILSFDLKGKAKQFTASIGSDDLANKDIAIRFYVIGDKKILFESGDMHVGDPAKKIDINLEGVQRLGLLVTDTAGGYNNKRTNGNWANAQLVMYDAYVPGLVTKTEEKYILTPLPKQTPKINSAKVFGATPGNPFLYMIAATGARPMQFSVVDLPQGLSLDINTGIITGAVKQRGIYTTTIKAKNTLGEASQVIKIKIGDTIALTPPIGWNGWNAWGEAIDQEKVLASTDAMKSTGLSDHGWTYINIDDTWPGVRGGANNALQPNGKFPAFKKMVDHIHSLGMKAGLYSTPYIASYGGYPGASSDFEKGGESHTSIMKDRRAFNHPGKYRFEKEDAKQMAEWGFDFLKYDWRVDVGSTEKMSEALRKSGRDVVLSLSNSAPFANVKDWMRLANMWRTGPDIKDSWNSLYQTTFTLDRWSPYGGPGHWNDADMMIVGNVSTSASLHPTRLTPDEQYSHVSMFSLLAAPLLIGCPIEQLDAFTLNLLTNDEVIEINQDPLGKPGRFIANENGVDIWMKEMEDGSYAVGLFNTDSFGKNPQSYFYWGEEKEKEFVFDFSKAALKGKWKLRDVWRQKDLGKFTASFKTKIRRHGVTMLRMYPEK